MFETLQLSPITPLLSNALWQNAFFITGREFFRNYISCLLFIGFPERILVSTLLQSGNVASLEKGRKIKAFQLPYERNLQIHGGVFVCFSLVGLN